MSRSSSSPASVPTALAAVLADTYALAVKTHAAHWNVTGAQFFSLHAAFGEQYEALSEAADDLAERLRALGSKAPAGLRAIQAATTVKDTDGDDGLALAKALRDDHRALSKACAKAVATAQAADDEATADLLIGRIEAHDKTAWMLDATIR
jgi:starvation-inducible DNA-binding protein